MRYSANLWLHSSTFPKSEVHRMGGRSFLSDSLNSRTDGRPGARSGVKTALEWSFSVFVVNCSLSYAGQTAAAIIHCHQLAQLNKLNKWLRICSLFVK